MHQKLSATIMHQEKLNALMVLNGHIDLTHAWIYVTLQINFVALITEEANILVFSYFDCSILY